MASGSNMATAFTESKAAFVKRAQEVGLAPAEVDHLVVSPLKQKVERTDDSAPTTLDVAEREDRLAAQKARLGGLTFQGEEEVAHGAYDIVFAMAQKNELTWLAPEKFGTRRAEISAKKAGKELVIDGTGVAVKDKPSVHNCIISSELDLVSALRRRALAFDLVGILSCDIANKYHQALIQRLQEAPPPGMQRCPSLRSCEQTERLS